MPNSNDTPLKYELILKKNIAVLSLAGSLNEPAESILLKCEEEIKFQQLEIRYLILNCKGITSIAPGIHRALVKLQMTVRSLKADLWVCSLDLNTSKELITQGIIRKEEYVKNLVEALNQIVKKNWD